LESGEEEELIEKNCEEEEEELNLLKYLFL